MSAPVTVILPASGEIPMAMVEANLLLEIAQAQAATDHALERLNAARHAELTAHDETVHADREYGNACERQRKIERVLEAYQAVDRKGS